MWHQQLVLRPQEAAALYKDHAVALPSSVLRDAGVMSPSTARDPSLGGMALVLPHVSDPEAWCPYRAPQRLMTPGEPRPAHVVMLFVAGLLAHAEPATSQL
jgi:hypothetical protein